MRLRRAARLEVFLPAAGAAAPPGGCMRYGHQHRGVYRSFSCLARVSVAPPLSVFIPRQLPLDICLQPSSSSALCLSARKAALTMILTTQSFHSPGVV